MDGSIAGWRCSQHVYLLNTSQDYWAQAHGEVIVNTPLRLKRSNLLFGVISTTNKLKPTFRQMKIHFVRFIVVTEYMQDCWFIMPSSTEMLPTVQRVKKKSTFPETEINIFTQCLFLGWKFPYLLYHKIKMHSIHLPKSIKLSLYACIDSS